MQSTRRAKEAFTLIELLIAIVVVGVMGSIAVPAIQKVVRNARATSFAHDIKVFAQAGAQYSLESGWWVEDTTTGKFPEELTGYISPQKFGLGSPLGGAWDFESFDEGNFASAVGVVDPSAGDNVFAIVDKRIDDGDLNTGFFQKTSNKRYYFIIED